VLVAPPKFREETSKKAVRLSASAGRMCAPQKQDASAFCCNAVFRHHLLHPVVYPLHYW
jgi:hypothetical protein